MEALAGTGYFGGSNALWQASVLREYGTTLAEDEAALAEEAEEAPEGGAALEDGGAARRRIALGVRVAEKARLGRLLQTMDARLAAGEDDPGGGGGGPARRDEL